MAVCSYPTPHTTPPSLFHRLSVHVYGIDEFLKKYCIWAYPTPRKWGLEVYMEASSPGLVSYVLGDDWETRVNEHNSIYDNQSTITEADEISLAERLLKPGGAALELPAWYLDACVEERNRKWSCIREQREYLFGWPDTGGVWVLRLLPPTVTGDTEEGMLAIEEMYDLVALGQESAEAFRVMTQGPLDLNVLVETKSMTDYCAALRELGATFYKNPKDSAEVARYRLLDNQLAEHWN